MKLRALKEAEDELWEATFFYEDRRPGLGLSFYDRAAEAVGTIDRDPLRFPLYGPDDKILHRSQLSEVFFFGHALRRGPFDHVVVDFAQHGSNMNRFMGTALSH